MKNEIVARKKEHSYFQRKLMFRVRKNENRSSELILTEKTIEVLELQNKGAVMFSFNRADRYGYIWKEDPQSDNYTVTIKARQKGGILFSNDLIKFFEKTFQPADRITAYILQEQPDEKKRFKFRIEEN